MTKALVLAGGYPQIALINELKSRGIYTLLADYSANPVAKDYADEFHRVSTLDTNAICELAKATNVDFLITACTDQALLTVAYVSEQLGKPCYIDYNTALNVTNKQYMKTVFVKNGIPTAKHVILDKYDPKALEELKFPLIIKPVDCNSSKGVKKVTNYDELIVAIENATILSRTNTAIVEEFVSGEELSVDVYVENGEAHVLSVSSLDKIPSSDKFIIFRGRYSYYKYTEVEKLVKGIAQKIANAFELKNSPMLIQMIYDGANAYVLEFSARTGGGVKFQLIKKASGFDVISAVVDLTLGLYPHFDRKPPVSKYIYNSFIYCEPGVFSKISGFDELKEGGFIESYQVFKTEGAVFNTIESSGDRIAGFTIHANTIEELRNKYNYSLQMMRVYDNNKKDIMRRDLLPFTL